MNKDKKVNIRIKFALKNNNNEPQETCPESNYIYHWPRIIGAALLIIGILSTGLYYIYHTSASQPKTTINTEKKQTVNVNPAMLSKQTPPLQSSRPKMKQTSENSQITTLLTTELSSKKLSETQIRKADQAENKYLQATLSEQKIADRAQNEKHTFTTPLSTDQIQANTQSEKKALNTPLSQKEIEKNDLENKKTLTPPLSAAEIAAHEQIEKQALSTPLSAAEIIANAQKDEATFTPKLTATAIAKDEQPALMEHRPQQTESPTQPIFTQTKTQIFSPQIKRFVLAKSINNKEPIGALENIQFDDNNIATVYAYSDAVGFADKFLYYQWLFDGKEVALVKVGAWANRWRSFSRKYIQPNKHGHWSVILKNTAGDKLAMAEFTY